MARKKKEKVVVGEKELAELQKVLAKTSGKMSAAQEDIIRDSYRVPCLPGDKAELIIGDNSFPLVNVGTRGLGILIPNVFDFSAGDLLEKIEFRMGEYTATFKGRVVHISLEGDNCYLCGISLVDMSEEQEKLLYSIIQMRRKELF